MLCTIEQITAIPPMSNPAAYPAAWLNTLIGVATGAVKRWLKQDVELQAVTEVYSGNEQRDVILRQKPVHLGMTTVADGSNGVALPNATINVASTVGFHPGLMGDANATPPTIAVQVGASKWTAVTYTGTTSTSFTGCSGGTGTMSTAAGVNFVYSPVVWWNPNARFGQQGFGSSQPPWQDGNLLVLGPQYVLVLDKGTRLSKRGLLRREGGQGQGFMGYFPEILYQGKLSAYRLPYWPRGDGNIQVAYNAGWALGSNTALIPTVPPEISYAAAALVCQMCRTQKLGGVGVSSESLGGAYSYSILAQDREWPEIGNLNRMLAPFREASL